MAKFSAAMLNYGRFSKEVCLYSEATGRLAFQRLSPAVGDGDSARAGSPANGMVCMVSKSNPHQTTTHTHTPTHAPNKIQSCLTQNATQEPYPNTNTVQHCNVA